MSPLGCVVSVNQLTEAKEGPLELRRKKARVCALREEGGKERHERKRERERERAHSAGCFALRDFMSFPKVRILGEVTGEDLNRIFISFPDLCFSGSWSLPIGWC